MPTTRTPFIGRLYFIYQSIGQIIFFQMMPPPRSFDDLDGKERGQKKTDDLRAMTTLGPRTLVLKEAYRCLNRDIAASLKLLTSGIAVIFPKGGLPLFSLTNQETRFTWLKLGYKGQGPLLTCKHQVKKKH